MDDFDDPPPSVALDVARRYARGGRVGYDEGGSVAAAPPVTTADILRQMPTPPEPSWHDKYIKPWGSVALAQQEPNWFGKNVLANIPDSVAMAANFLTPAARVPIPRVANPIKGYHGSPHDFAPEPGHPLGRFRMDKIGTGEGAQAYGHGVYIAENEGVARSYRDSLSPLGLGVVARGRLRQFGGDMEKTLAYMRERPQTEAGAEALAQLEKANMAGSPPGHMYEVALHARPEQFLDWDKPLAAQSRSVRSALDRLLDEHLRDFNTDLPVKDLLENLQLRGSRARANPQSAIAHELEKAGIPGIKFLDQMSRGAGQGTSNYAVWSPAIIQILKKYGIIAPVAGAGLVNSLSPPNP